ncbi:hypothetical protein [Mitsuaria sp. 7]|uniref:hypothetical protein n=1 Tax=Mitsuaria sp. 7 TaxID=1658665 RepID=UPI0007DD92D9|nr:hypothetical protein [Mitsuaria sp. 7]ANH67116.1 hypothetical protein ABE85_05205 [Mitsuaria sp. 7]
MSAGGATTRTSAFPSDPSDPSGPVVRPVVQPPPTTPAKLTPTTDEERDVGFDGLRARGITLLQQLSGGVWTDHNLHDPGITMLEQLCFGLTDVVYRAGFPVADHLTGPDGSIDYEALSLHPPAEVFPCRPTTPADYRRHLLDATPGLDDATLVPEPGTGLYRLQLQLTQDTGRSMAGSTSGLTSGLTSGSAMSSPGGSRRDPALSDDVAAERIAAARAAYFERRNLGEDLHPDIVRMRDVPCDLQADIDVAGPRDAVDILAEVYDRCARHIARAAVSRTLDELLREGHPLERIYTGPALRNGFIEDAPAPEAGYATERLFLSDLTTVVLSVPGVVDARVVALRAEGREATAGSVEWRGPDWALSLRLPDRDVPSTISVRRRGNVVPVAWNDLRRRLEDLRSAGRSHRAHGLTEQAARAAELLPRGVHRKLDTYVSVQDHLPAIYGLGRYGVPTTAPAQRQARARQLKAYLVMQEQAIAQGLAQLQHLRELFSVAPGARQGLWTQMIGPKVVPGLKELYKEAPEVVSDAVYKPFDRSARRKNRALDHLLALHGETYTQNSMRQFLGHLSPEESETLLLENKATWLRDIVQLTRDRAGGFDPTRPSWDVVDNCGGLQRRASLLLGFKQSHDRPLTRALREQRFTLVAKPGAAHQPWLLDGQDEAVRLAPSAGHAVQPAGREQVREDLQRMPWLRLPIPAGLLRAGQHSARFRLMPVASGFGSASSRGGTGGTGGAGSAGGGGEARRLILGPDENRQWWLLGDFPDAAAARRGAASLRLFLRHLDQESEGLHVVEHVLLRPLRQDGLSHARLGLSKDFHQLRVTVVLPGWTQRTSQPAFRNFAEETLRISCPSHLTLRCLWLDAEPMQRFEDTYAAWLEARLAWTEAPGDDRARTLADETACRVIERLGVDDDPTLGGVSGSGRRGEDDGHGPIVQGHA